MLIDNKIEKTASGPAIFMGIASLAFGIGSFLGGYLIIGILSILLAWFLLLSYSGIQINTTERIVKPYNCWFGVIKTGKWKTLDAFIGLTLVPIKKVYTVYSRSNRSTTSKKTEFRVYLVNKSKKPVQALKSCEKHETAQNSMDEFAIWLHLPVYSVKH